MGFGVIEAAIAPAYIVVALAAVVAVLAKVSVIIAMAADTGLWKIFGDCPHGMAGCALQRLVGTHQFKMSISVVVEFCVFPAGL